MYLYETHLHTSPVSKCSCASVRRTLEFYKAAGYQGVFITNHFLDGNINIDRALPYTERLEFYFSDYEEAMKIKDEIGIDVFLGVEMSYGGTDFLVYGLDKQWWMTHTELEGMPKKAQLELLRYAGALVIQAHPFREAGYIDHIRLFPRSVDGVEVYNACRTDFENERAEEYARAYGLIPFSGSDNHRAELQPVLGGITTEEPLTGEGDLCRLVKQKAHGLIVKRENDTCR